MLSQFVEKTGIPFVTTQLGKGVIDETHPSSWAARRFFGRIFVHRRSSRRPDRQYRP
jgi:acetolactate synthase-1/2/3 large subunit